MPQVVNSFDHHRAHRSFMLQTTFWEGAKPTHRALTTEFATQYNSSGGGAPSRAAGGGDGRAASPPPSPSSVIADAAAEVGLRSPSVGLEVEPRRRARAVNRFTKKERARAMSPSPNGGRALRRVPGACVRVRMRTRGRSSGSTSS